MDAVNSTRWSAIVSIGCAMLVAAHANAKTPDGVPPSIETVCSGLSGAARGLCNAFCEAQDCDVHPRPSCDQLRSNFAKQTGSSVFPCEAPVPTGTGGATAIVTPTPRRTPTAIPTTTIPTPCPPGAAAFPLVVAGKYPLGGDSALPFGTVNFTDSAATLVMPFDVSTNHASFQMVSRTQNPNEDPDIPVVATHWTYWSTDCRHLADVFICLTRDDSVVVDPTHLQSQIQSAGANVSIGPIIDLTGLRGIVTVTAFEADPSSLAGNTCAIVDPTAILDQEIVGHWGIVDTQLSVGFGHDAIGLDAAGVGDLDPGILDPENGGSLVIQTLNPSALQRSQVILIGLESSEFSGNGRFLGSEVGPIVAPLNAEGAKVCCNATFTDDLEIRVSLPNVCFECAGFAAISSNTASAGDPAIIPPVVSVNSAGFVTLSNCLTADPTDPSIIAPIGQSVPQFLFAFHAEALF